MNASLIGRLLMRRFVKMCVPEVEYNEFEFGRDPKGRPLLLYNNRESTTNIPESLHLDFNVSHHGSYAVLAGFVRQTTPGDSDKLSQIGVDVMNTKYTGGKPLHEFFRIMNRTFTPNEWTYIWGRSTERAQSEAFMRHWCLKESYVKSIGIGVTMNLQRIDFTVNTDCLTPSQIALDTRLCVDAVNMNDWIFEESLLDEDHCVAVSVSHSDVEYRKASRNSLFEKINFEQLMECSTPLLTEDLPYCTNILAKEYKPNR